MTAARPEPRARHARQPPRPERRRTQRRRTRGARAVCRWSGGEAIASVRDLSVSGLAVRSNAPPPVGTEVVVRVFAPGFINVVAAGRVVRVDRDPSGGARVAVCFEGLGGLDRATLAHIVAGQ